MVPPTTRLTATNRCPLTRFRMPTGAGAARSASVARASLPVIWICSARIRLPTFFGHHGKATLPVGRDRRARRDFWGKRKRSLTEGTEGRLRR